MGRKQNEDTCVHWQLYQSEERNRWAKGSGVAEPAQRMVQGPVMAEQSGNCPMAVQAMRASKKSFPHPFERLC